VGLDLVVGHEKAVADDIAMERSSSPGHRRLAVHVLLHWPPIVVLSCSQSPAVGCLVPARLRHHGLYDRPRTRHTTERVETTQQTIDVNHHMLKRRARGPFRWAAPLRFGLPGETGRGNRAPSARGAHSSSVAS
jgi:hypothetical protein